MRYLIFLITIFASIISAQQGMKSIHQQEWEYYNDHPEKTLQHNDLQKNFKKRDRLQSSNLNAIVYGFHPYWVNGSEQYYYFNLLTHLAYFSADVNVSTGNFSSTHNYSTANVINQAKSAGVKVHLTITCFSGHATLFSSQTNVDRLINNIIAKVHERNIDGVNIDFESMSNSVALPFKNFILQLGDTLKKYDKELVVELFAVDWNNIFPASFFAEVDHVVDYYFIMLYAYYYGGSSTAGPNSPLRLSTAGGYHVLKSIDTHLAKGCPPEKLIAGFPYYGFDWPVVSSARMAAATATGSSRFYHIAKNNYLDTMQTGNIFFDATYSVPWYRYHNGTTWRQTWYDDSLSLSLKYDSIKTRNIAGVGMWALGYDAAEPELWGALQRAFASTTLATENEIVPFQFMLEQNYPNPFNPSTVINYQIPVNSMVTLKVYDAIGREVGTLVNEIKEAGYHSVRFDASKFASGVYFATLTSDTKTQVKKLILMK